MDMETKDVRVQGGGFSAPVEDKAVRGPKEPGRKTPEKPKELEEKPKESGVE